MRKIAVILISILLTSEAFAYSCHDKTCLRPEMAFGKHTSAEDMLYRIYNDSEARDAGKLIDRYVRPNDNILCVGQGDSPFIPVGCAVKEARVDIVQPVDYDGYPQMEKLEEAIESCRENMLALSGGVDLIEDRINTTSYGDIVEKVALPKDHYSCVFIFKVYDTVDEKRAFIDSILPSLKDNAYIFVSLTLGYSTKESEPLLQVLENHMKEAGYSVGRDEGSFTDCIFRVSRNSRVKIPSQSPAGQAL